MNCMSTLKQLCVHYPGGEATACRARVRLVSLRAGSSSSSCGPGPGDGGPCCVGWPHNEQAHGSDSTDVDHAPKTGKGIDAKARRRCVPSLLAASCHISQRRGPHKRNIGSNDKCVSLGVRGGSTSRRRTRKREGGMVRPALALFTSR